jgi:phosphate transport system protein
MQETRHQFRESLEKLERETLAGVEILDGEINRLNREIFSRAVDVGDHLEVREWAMFMILVARCLERIAGNTIDIAEQTVFVVTGLFREFGGESQPA